MTIQSHNLSLLYIDDDTAIRKNATEYFSKIFQKVFEASNGLEGYRLYQTFKPDLIITDIKMPLLSGLEMTRKIRTNDPKTPIIILSAFTDTQMLLEAVELRLVKYLIKPFNERSIHEALILACHAMTENCNNIFRLNEKCYYDSFNKVFFLDNIPIKLTAYELRLIDLLIKSSPRTVTYEEIQNIVWPDEGINIDSLRTLVKSLRKKIQCDAIRNLSGVGYSVELL